MANLVFNSVVKTPANSSLTIGNISTNEKEIFVVSDLPFVNLTLAQASSVGFMFSGYSPEAQVYDGKDAIRFKVHSYNIKLTKVTKPGLSDFSPTDVFSKTISWNALQGDSEFLIDKDSETIDPVSFLTDRVAYKLPAIQAAAILKVFETVATDAQVQVDIPTASTGAEKAKALLKAAAAYGKIHDDSQSIAAGSLNYKRVLIYCSTDLWIDISDARRAGDGVVNTFDLGGNALTLRTAVLGGFRVIITDELPAGTEALIVTDLTYIYSFKSTVAGIEVYKLSNDVVSLIRVKDIEGFIVRHPDSPITAPKLLATAIHLV